MVDLEQVITLLEHTSYYYIICTDMSGKYSYVNKNYAKKFSHVNDNLIGQEFSITMHPDDIFACRKAGMESLMHPALLVPVSIRKHDGKGGYITTQWEFTGIFNADETPKGVFCLGYDITEFIDQLAGKDNLLSDIAFSQSHVVRRPVANILGAVGILKDYELPAEVKTIIDILLKSALDLDSVIRKISENIYK